MATYGYTFQSGAGVTPTRLNDARTISNIVDADIGSGAAISLSKLATGALPTAITTTTANIADASVTAAKLAGAQTGSAPIYGCRAWVNFNGAQNATNTGASTNGANVFVRASGNVASVLKTGTGAYTVTFTTAMPDANYAIVSGSSQTLASLHFGHLSFGAQTASSFGVLFSRQDDGALRADDQLCMLAIFR